MHFFENFFLSKASRHVTTKLVDCCRLVDRLGTVHLRILRNKIIENQIRIRILYLEFFQDRHNNIHKYATRIRLRRILLHTMLTIKYTHVKVFVMYIHLYQAELFLMMIVPFPTKNVRSMSFAVIKDDSETVEIGNNMHGKRNGLMQR